MKKPSCSFPLGRVLALLLTLGATQASSLRADDMVRQIQEELRKRNLYFGDVDGRLSTPTAAALRRYQQRKGFPSTGEPDAVTLHSLTIPVPPSLAAAAASPLPPGGAATPPPLTPSSDAHPWPDITVLRSDEARRLSPEIATAAAEPAATPTAPPRPPPAAASRTRITREEARAFIEHYLQAGQANDTRAELEFYADRVDYFDEGVVDQRFIEADITRYDRRWPERRFILLEPFTVVHAPDGDPGKTVVNFRYQFSNKGPKYLVRGKTDNTWTLAGEKPSELRIVAVKEQRVRE